MNIQPPLNSTKKGTWAPMFVRLGWHTSGTFDPHSEIKGGSNGATMRFYPEVCGKLCLENKKGNRMRGRFFERFNLLSYSMFLFSSCVPMVHILFICIHHSKKSCCFFFLLIFLLSLLWFSLLETHTRTYSHTQHTHRAMTLRTAVLRLR